MILLFILGIMDKKQTVFFNSFDKVKYWFLSLFLSKKRKQILSGSKLSGIS
jgi:hypothetical protein